MPLYEYQCQRCNKKFEVIQKFSDPPLTVHEECGGEVERLISPPAIQFKGTGWYVTDYAGNGKGGGSTAKAEGNGKPEAKPEVKAESKSDTKAAPKTESKSSPSTPDK